MLLFTACSGGQQGSQEEATAETSAVEPISGDGLVIENGMAQQIASYTDPMKEDYTNEGSELLRFVVYVETDNDTDMDGKPDLAKTMVQVPLQGSTNSTSRTCTRSLRSARLPEAWTFLSYPPENKIFRKYKSGAGDILCSASLCLYFFRISRYFASSSPLAMMKWPSSISIHRGGSFS